MSKSKFQDKQITGVVKKLRQTINARLALIGQKLCVHCNEVKCISEFGKSKQQKDGLFPYCYECARKIQEEARRKKGISPQRKRTIDELPLTKICTVCKIEKPKEDFRIRNIKGYITLNTACLDCEVIRQKKYYYQKRNDPEFKRKNSERTKKYRESECGKIRMVMNRKKPEWLKKHSELENKRYHRKKDEIAAKMKIKRQSPEYKNKIREYRDRNKERIREQEKITKRRYHEKHRDSISDKYCIRQLISQGLATYDNVTPELIELERQKILLTRLKLKIKTYGKENNKSK